MVGDLLAGFFLFAEHQFAFGDVIRLSSRPDGGITGTVEELTLRVTKLRTAQGELVVVPNSALRQVTNLSKDWSRAVIDIPVLVTEDLDHVTSILRDVVGAMAADSHWSELLLGDPSWQAWRPSTSATCSSPHRPHPAWTTVRVAREIRLRATNALRSAGSARHRVVGTDEQRHGRRAVAHRSPDEPGGTPAAEEKRQSGLAGFMSVPVNPKFPIRRSTLLMAVAFLASAQYSISTLRPARAWW